jgi:hypothetical protein
VLYSPKFTEEGSSGERPAADKTAWLSDGRGWDRTSDLPRVKRSGRLDGT